MYKLYTWLKNFSDKKKYIKWGQEKDPSKAHVHVPIKHFCTIEKITQYATTKKEQLRDSNEYNTSNHLHIYQPTYVLFIFKISYGNNIILNIPKSLM